MSAEDIRKHLLALRASVADEVVEAGDESERLLREWAGIKDPAAGGAAAPHRAAPQPAQGSEPSSSSGGDPRRAPAGVPSRTAPDPTTAHYRSGDSHRSTWKHDAAASGAVMGRRDPAVGNSGFSAEGRQHSGFAHSDEHGSPGSPFAATLRPETDGGLDDVLRRGDSSTSERQRGYQLQRYDSTTTHDSHNRRPAPQIGPMGTDVGSTRFTRPTIHPDYNPSAGTPDADGGMVAYTSAGSRDGAAPTSWSGGRHGDSHQREQHDHQHQEHPRQYQGHHRSQPHEEHHEQRHPRQGQLHAQLPQQQQQHDPQRTHQQSSRSANPQHVDEHASAGTHQRDSVGGTTGEATSPGAAQVHAPQSRPIGREVPSREEHPHGHGDSSSQGRSHEDALQRPGAAPSSHRQQVEPHATIDIGDVGSTSRSKGESRRSDGKPASSTSQDAGRGEGHSGLTPAVVPPSAGRFGGIDAEMFISEDDGNATSRSFDFRRGSTSPNNAAPTGGAMESGRQPVIDRRPTQSPELVMHGNVPPRGGAAGGLAPPAGGHPELAHGSKSKTRSADPVRKDPSPSQSPNSESREGSTTLAERAGSGLTALHLPPALAHAAADGSTSVPASPASQASVTGETLPQALKRNKSLSRSDVEHLYSPTRRRKSGGQQSQGDLPLSPNASITSAGSFSVRDRRLDELLRSVSPTARSSTTGNSPALRAAEGPRNDAPVPQQYPPVSHATQTSPVDEFIVDGSGKRVLRRAGSSELPASGRTAGGGDGAAVDVARLDAQESGSKLPRRTSSSAGGAGSGVGLGRGRQPEPLRPSSVIYGRRSSSTASSAGGADVGWGREHSADGTDGRGGSQPRRSHSVGSNRSGSLMAPSLHDSEDSEDGRGHDHGNGSFSQQGHKSSHHALGSQQTGASADDEAGPMNPLTPPSRASTMRAKGSGWRGVPEELDDARRDLGGNEVGGRQRSQSGAGNDHRSQSGHSLGRSASHDSERGRFLISPAMYTPPNAKGGAAQVEGGEGGSDHHGTGAGSGGGHNDSWRRMYDGYGLDDDDDDIIDIDEQAPQTTRAASKKHQHQHPPPQPRDRRDAPLPQPAGLQHPRDHHSAYGSAVASDGSDRWEPPQRHEPGRAQPHVAPDLPGEQQGYHGDSASSNARSQPPTYDEPPTAPTTGPPAMQDLRADLVAQFGGAPMPSKRSNSGATSLSPGEAGPRKAPPPRPMSLYTEGATMLLDPQRPSGSRSRGGSQQSARGGRSESLDADYLEHRGYVLPKGVSREALVERLSALEAIRHGEDPTHYSPAGYMVGTAGKPHGSSRMEASGMVGGADLSAAGVTANQQERDRQLALRRRASEARAAAGRHAAEALGMDPSLLEDGALAFERTSRPPWKPTALPVGAADSVLEAPLPPPRSKSEAAGGGASRSRTPRSSANNSAVNRTANGGLKTASLSPRRGSTFVERDQKHANPTAEVKHAAAMAKQRALSPTFVDQQRQQQRRGAPFRPGGALRKPAQPTHQGHAHVHAAPDHRESTAASRVNIADSDRPKTSLTAAHTSVLDYHKKHAATEALSVEEAAARDAKRAADALKAIRKERYVATHQGEVTRQRIFAERDARLAKQRAEREAHEVRRRQHNAAMAAAAQATAAADVNRSRGSGAPSPVKYRNDPSVDDSPHRSQAAAPNDQPDAGSPVYRVSLA